MIKITMKNGGVIKLELDKVNAPISSDNFEKLAKEDFYNGLTFHRVIKGFMIQGGCPFSTGTGSSKDKIVGEFKSNGKINDLTHKRGVISMARSADKNSASCQFFIVHQDAPHLDCEYAAFGKVIEGMDVVDQIAEVKTDRNDKPLEPQIIESIEVL